MFRSLFQPLFQTPVRRVAVLLFCVPWLLIWSIAPLRTTLRVHALGSEFNARGMGITPLTIWFGPLPLTQKQLQSQAPQELWPLIQLKAPLNRGEHELTPGDVLKACNEAQKRAPNSGFWQAMRLHTLLFRVPLRRLRSDDKGFGLTKTGNRWSDPWQSTAGYYYQSANAFPTVGKGQDSYYQEDEDEINLPHAALPAKNFDALSQALTAAQRGARLEPDNAFWPYQESYLLLLQNRDAQAWHALQRAAQLPRYDSHLRGEVRAALRVAQLHRAILIEDKLAVFERQIHKEVAWPAREKLWLLQSLRAETKGDQKRALAIARALTQIGAKMQKGALSPLQVRCGIILQCAAWRGWKRVPQWRANKKSYPYSLSELGCLQWEYNAGRRGAARATPLLFAQQFAQAARRAGNENWAREALQMGRAATRLDGGAHTYYQNEDRYLKWALFDALLPTIAFDTAAAFLLVQGQFVLAGWLMLNVVLWRRLWFFGRWGMRIGNVVAMIWRVRDKPLWDEEVVWLEHSPRDARRVFWLIGAFALLGTGGFVYYCSLSFSSAFQEFWREQNEAFAIASFLLFLFPPFVIGTLWCGGVTLRRYLKLKTPRVWRDDIETGALRAPPSLFPRAAAFATWSLTGLALACWAGLLLSRIFPAAAFFFALPPLWARLLNQNSISLFSRWDEWLVVALMASFITLIAWVWKWLWQLHARRRLPALFMAARWLSHLFGAWIIIVSWLYLFLLCAALPSHDKADARFEKIIAGAPLRTQK